MKHTAQKSRRLSANFPVPIYIAGAAFTLFVLVVATSCSSYIFAPEEQGESDGTINAAVQATVEVAVAETVTAIDSSASTATATDAEDAATDNEEVAAVSEQEQLMQWVTANTRHYIGDPNAPVVFIEFGDFQ